MYVWQAEEQWLFLMSSYMYLGVHTNSSLCFKNHLSITKLQIYIKYKYKNYETISGKNFWVETKLVCQTNVKYLKRWLHLTMLCMPNLGLSLVWGSGESVEVFCRKILFLPSNTSSYMIRTKTGRSANFHHTLKLHFDFINWKL